MEACPSLARWDPSRGPMIFLQSLPIVVSCLLMAAHLFRGQHYALVLLSLLMPLLLLIPRRWIARAIQLGLLISAAEWVRTAAKLMQERTASGQPYLRMALILGAVALFTLGAALIFQLPAMRRRYTLKVHEEGMKSGL